MLLTGKPIILLLKKRNKVEIYRMNNSNKKSKTLTYSQFIVFIAFKQPRTRLPEAASKNLHKTSSLA